MQAKASIRSNKWSDVSSSHALCYYDSTHSEEYKTRVAPSGLFKGKERGCDGCRLVCEVLPLLGGYHKSEVDAHNTWFGRGSALLNDDSTRPWTLVVEDENDRWAASF
jgi:hypothetical protein